MGEELDREIESGNMFMRELYDWIESFITAVLCAVLIFVFAGRLVVVFGESMLPTLNDHDRLASVSFMYKPKNGDIVVITKPNLLNEPLIKRVIAIGGQTLDIDFKTNSVFVDGERIDEPYILEPMEPRSRSDLTFPLTVPEGYVFVMGDNRNNSWDSRREQVGLVDERHILGKVVYRVSPYSDIGVPR